MPLTTWPTSPNRIRRVRSRTQRSASRLPSGMEDIGSLPEFLQHVHQIQDQGDVESLVHSNLESTLAVSQGQARHGSRRIAAVHLFGHLLDHGGLTLEQARPHALVLRTWGRRRCHRMVGREVGKRLSMTCCGVRTQGARVKTVATVAMRFLLAFCPLVSRAVGCAPPA